MSNPRLESLQAYSTAQNEYPDYYWKEEIIYCRECGRPLDYDGYCDDCDF